MVFLMVILVKSSPSLQKMKIKKMKSKWSYLLMKKKLCINEMNMTIFHMLTVFPFINPKEVNFLSFYYLSYRRMLKKNLLDAAITRGKQSLIICGEKDAFLQGIQTEDTNQRYTSLPEQLSKRIHLPSSNKTNPIEEEITPYDFME